MSDPFRDFDTLSRIYHSLPVTERVAWMRQHSIEWSYAVRQRQGEAKSNARAKIKGEIDELPKAPLSGSPVPGPAPDPAPGYLVKPEPVLPPLSFETVEEVSEELRKKRNREREARRKDRKKAYLESLPANMNALPIEWILDGSWGLLSSPAHRVLPVIYGLLDPAGRKLRLSYGVICELAGCSRRTASRGVREGWREGWIGVTLVRTPAMKSFLYFYLPPRGLRQTHRESDLPVVHGEGLPGTKGARTEQAPGSEG